MINKLNFSLFKKIPVVLQTEAAECGLACLAMVRGYYGGDANLFQLRGKYGISSKGATLKNLVDIATDLNLITRPLSLELEELKLLRLPCILHWDFNHFVVLTKATERYVVIHDPAFGKKKISIAECSKHFTGVALEVWTEVKFEKEKNREEISLYETVKNISGIKGALVKIFSLSILIELIVLLMPVGTQLVIDHVLQAKDQSLLLIICFGLFLFTFFRSAISLSRAWISLKMSYLIDFQWTSSFFSHLLKLPLDFFEKRQVGDIQSRFTSLRTIQSTLTQSIVTAIIDLIMTVSVMIMMFLYGGWLTWLVVAFSLAYLLLRLATYLTYHQITEEQIIKNAKASSHFMETLYGIATLKSLGLNKKREEHWMSLNADAFNTSIRVTKLDMFFSGVHTFISTLEQIMILWVGASMVIDNTLTVGMFMAFNAYRGSFSSRMGSLINVVFSFKMLSLHRERIADIALTEAENEIYYPQPTKTPDSQQGAAISVKNLSFRYDPFSEPVFTNLNLSIQAGESVAISAKSGFGKTTLLKLMSGLLKPTQGEIYFNHLDIKQLGLANYRQHIACVLQDDKFFSGSILENIVSFEEKYDSEFAIECAKLAQIHDDIMAMPMNYETLIGELGNNLSGGQRQRLFIARALYKKPKILFMDEATSHLDEENEKKINEAISKLAITRVLVAHRKSTIESADRIVNL
ncbi:peptidase domain-containing ABC transporter [Glaesserella parasuis]|uniref:Peptidase domain-containing ABC transporter n=1 Tax=Glaesserella parasuis TaxID=738 RepID=A0A6M8T0H0_GLAPU|nr:peptidase domain-containing ABC transporter [Glaesserella parasuis]EQA01129.1 ABC transporter transmembrane region family protein [Glaesserella parasuis SW114]MDD2168901.1 peptidase domain-containing ABC transporter [Glaesserella parasuis]MDD2173429.1 peptidase domain-containing ABC transporter [Glaesserella parasuis]MDG6345977.1 peptidase domain-containing ABC transporter [Glaesserella parasuis]MDG6447198.1 peptidase domain-containing ABC transporter [Glaesserella parasuis]